MSNYLKFWNLRENFSAFFQRDERKPEQVKAILDDLHDFCRAESSCAVFGNDGHYDTHATAVLEGRREVYLRIMAHINLPDETLNRMKEMEND